MRPRRRCYPLVGSPVNLPEAGFERELSAPDRKLLSSIEDETAWRCRRDSRISKLRDYCLDPRHPRGRHKARVFLLGLGLKQSDADFLRAALLDAAVEEDAVPGEADEYGARYIVDFPMTHGDREAMVRSAWIILQGELAPRLTSCFVL